MNIYLMIKNTFRNKRFIFFTILTPVFWYIALVMMSKTSGFYKTKHAYIWFTVSCLIGIAGNSLVSFAKSINSMKNFYELQIATSKYTILKWLYDEIIVQLVLNTIICLVILIVMFLIGHVEFSLKFVLLIIILNILGCYLSLFGFTLGQFFNARAIDASSFLTMLVISFLIVPFYAWVKSDWVSILANVQRVFPGYYVNQLTQHLFLGGELLNPAICFIFSIILTSIPEIIALLWKFKIKS
ncbi:hypothetical protein EQT97_01915 [Fructilactobacillus sanfranciscensis]|uniref:hypothetical protein n=1 Tax=Fructilactobacillus sanfranciscensis TaxID=1625 RepID=UPI001EF0D576|nr:hypothetical protein [Fructilactobacillus sanfranciscensis]MCG7194296.1 hypothetical protein [Fructilactobacillus sanfranciscensis]